MKLTNKQKQDLETVMFYIPNCYSHIKITDEAIQKYFEWSDQGKHKDDPELFEMAPKDPTPFYVLVYGKKRRGLHVDLYEQSILEGTIPYTDLLRDLPKSVIKFMSINLFKGADKELIESFMVDMELGVPFLTTRYQL